MRTLSLFMALFLSFHLFAEERGDAPPPPPISESEGEPSATMDDAQIIEELERRGYESEVTIIKRDGGLIEEYRANGMVYMVKITPDKGYPYYLIDSDGDGSFETRRNELDSPEVVQWRIFSW